MAINIPIITSLEDKGIRAAKDAFSNFRTAVANAEGGMGKFKAGSKVALDSVKANAGLFAVVAGAAIGKFAIEAIGQFQDLALAAGKFADATGLAVEDASRYMEAAGDIGVPVDALEGAIGRLNRTIGADPDKVRDLGVDLVYLKDGSLDVNETFLNTIERIKGIKDPAEKAKVAAQLLGKGWQSMSELIEMGADDLKKSLDGVSDSKIIDKDEVDKAKDYRAATDNLKDAFEDMAISLGERLIPKVTLLVEALATLPDSLRGAGGVVQEVFSVEDMAAMGDEASITRLEFERLAEMYGGYYASRVQGAKDDTYMLEQQMLDLEQATSDTDQAFKDLKDELNLQSAVADAKEQLVQLQEKAVAAFQGSDGALGEYEQGLIDAKLRVLELAESIVLTDSQKNQIRVLVDTGDLERAIGFIDVITAGGYTAELNAMRFRGPRALGGPVASGGSYLVGERGPELFTPSLSGNITPNSAIGSNTINITVQGADPNEVVRALQAYNRNVGKVPVSVQ